MWRRSRTGRIYSRGDKAPAVPPCLALAFLKLACLSSVTAYSSTALPPPLPLLLLLLLRRRFFSCRTRSGVLFVLVSRRFHMEARLHCSNGRSSTCTYLSRVTASYWPRCYCFPYKPKDPHAFAMTVYKSSNAAFWGWAMERCMMKNMQFLYWQKIKFTFCS